MMECNYDITEAYRSFRFESLFLKGKLLNLAHIRTRCVSGILSIKISSLASEILVNPQNSDISNSGGNIFCKFLFSISHVEQNPHVEPYQHH